MLYMLWPNHCRASLTELAQLGLQKFGKTHVIILAQLVSVDMLRLSLDALRN
jgi:hypothetical protein